jgi:hypothetical protein
MKSLEESNFRQKVEWWMPEAKEVAGRGIVSSTSKELQLG